MIQGTPEDIIQQSIDSIEIEPELLTLERIEETIGATKTLRQNKIDDLVAQNGQLEHAVATLSNEIELLHRISDYNHEVIRDLSTFSDSAHVSVSEFDKSENIFKVLNKKSGELDNIKVSIAKNLNDLESSLNTLKLSKSTLLTELTTLKSHLDEQFSKYLQDPYGDTLAENDRLVNQNSHVLKINLFRNLGVRIENFNESEEDKDRIVIYNKETDLSSVLKVDEKYSDYFISNYIWERLEGYN